MLSRNDSDFIVGSNGHAGLSNRKAAELLKVQHTSVDDALKFGVLYTSDELEFIATQGFQGGVLVKLATRFAKSDKVKPETRKHCVEFLEKAAIIGAQVFLDQLAGIAPAAPQPQQLAFDAQVRLEADLLQKMLSTSDLHCNIVSGVLLNFAGSRLPALKSAVNEAHGLLAAATPSPLLLTPTAIGLLTPTAIGERLGVSARQVNLLLLDLGYQVKNLAKKSKDEPSYLPTDIGRAYASNTLATGRMYDDGADNTSYQHLKWKSEVVEILRELLVEV
jgi:hypothetical protein